MDQSDATLARAAQHGDRQAFGVLVTRLRAPMVGYVVGLIRNRDDAEETAQEAFLVGWQRLPTLREPARVASWLFRIARNLALSRQRAARTAALETEPVDDTDCPGDERIGPLLQAITELSESHREVILRKHFSGLDGETIARQLGIAAGTVRSRLSRAYAELRRRIEVAQKQ